MGNLKIKQMDTLQNKVGKELQKRLESYYNTKVEVSYVNLGYSTDRREFIVNIYMQNNKYDYKQFGMTFNVDATIEDYMIFIQFQLINNKFDEHIATVEEKYIIDLLREYECKNIYMSDSILYCEGEEYACMDCIDDLHYKKSDCILEIIEDSDEKFIVDFANDTITYVEEDDEIIKIQGLQEELDKLNSTTDNIKYVIIDNQICELDVKSGKNLFGYWCDLKDIIDFGVDENDEVWIQIANEEFITLTKNGGTM